MTNAHKVDSVLVDRSEAAYTLYLAVPASRLDELKQKLDPEANVEILELPAFIRQSAKVIPARIVRDEYPGSRVVDGVVEVLKQYPQSPIGVTWNGGIAITYSDYEHAKRTYASHLGNPAASGRTQDPAGDPTDPARHLGPLLGWS